MLTSLTPPPPNAYRLFPTTSGPATAVSYSGPFIAGVVVGVTTGGCWLDGYWWWVCNSGQSTSPQKFALWQTYNGQTGNLVSGSTVTSGTLTAGQWNYVPLTAPLLLPLAIGATYVAATGFSGSFPDTNSQFGSGDQYAAGIVSGPLTAYSDATGTMPSPFKTDQGVFSVASTDPTTAMPIYGSSAANFWMDVQVTTIRAARYGSPVRPSFPRLPVMSIRIPRGTRWPRSSRSPSHARWTTSGCSHPARRRCPLGARSGMSARRAWSQAPATHLPHGREQPGLAGWRARTAASHSPPGTTRWRCTTAAGPKRDQATTGYWGSGQVLAASPAGRFTAPAKPPPRAPASAPTTRAPGPTRRPTAPGATARTSGLTSRSRQAKPASLHNREASIISERTVTIMRFPKGLLVGVGRPRPRRPRRLQVAHQGRLPLTR